MFLLSLSTDKPFYLHKICHVVNTDYCRLVVASVPASCYLDCKLVRTKAWLCVTEHREAGVRVFPCEFWAYLRYSLTNRGFASLPSENYFPIYYLSVK